MSEKLKRTYNPCDECPYGIEKRNGSGNDSTCKICEFADLVKANRRVQQPNEPLTLEQLQQMDEERVWTQFRGLGMYGLVAYRSDPDGDDGDNVYITNNLGGRDTFEEILDQGGTVYARKPEAGETE